MKAQDLCVIVLLLGAGGVLTPAQPVQGDVADLGFRAKTGTGRVVREGNWFPVLVQLYAQGGSPQQVELRVERTDLDGDRVEFATGPVTVTPGSPRRMWCYVSSNKRTQPEPGTVDVLDADGALLTRIDLPLFELMDTDTRLILDVSARRLAALDRLDSGNYYAITPGERRYYRNVCVATLSAGNLPDRWFGLEAVDTLVWDEPDPSVLNDPAQLPALIEWVRNGGELVLGIGAAWEEVRASALIDVLPLAPDGEVVEVEALPRFLAKFARGSQTRFDNAIAIVAAESRADADALVSDLVRGRSLPLVAIRSVGAGQVIASTARLGDLLAYDSFNRFTPRLFGLNPVSDDFRTNEAKSLTMAVSNPASLFPNVVRPTEFRAAASLLVLLAFGFVGAYIVLSTFVSWVWLKQKGLTHLSWIVFSGFAVVVAALSLGAVMLVRGVVDSVSAFSFVDMEAGSGTAHAYAYIGYKSSRRRDIDFSLDGPGSFVRPMTPGYFTCAQYSTADRYAAQPAAGELLDVPMRATLKQFEGVWNGVVDGRVSGQLTARRMDGQITPDSWLRSELGVDVEIGYLLYIDPRLSEDGGVPTRVAGLTARTDRQQYLGSEQVPPAVNVLGIGLPELPDGQRVTDLGKGVYEEYERRLQRWRQVVGKPEDEPMLPTLWHFQNGDWAPSVTRFATLRRMDPLATSALLASTRDLLLHNGGTAGKFDSAATPIVTGGLMDVDVTHWLRGGQNEGTAVLLLFVDAPAPIGLHREGGAAPVHIRGGSTLYRVRMPIRYVGRPRGP